jgi:WXG100 family type VII secretion target
MSDLKVNFGGLSTAAADIQAGANNVESRLAELERALQPLRANWSGEASNAYEAARTKWSAALTDMKALLADIGRSVSTSGDDYQSTERTNTSRW